MIYTAISDTYLKKFPVQASCLADDKKVRVISGKQYPIKKVIEDDGLHSHVELDYDAGDWWLFKPHWDIEQNRKSVQNNSPVEAIFRMRLAYSRILIYGTLEFIKGSESLLKVKATSGSAGYQYRGAHTVRGRGCIPPAFDWKINTNGYYLATKGVEGMFYHITPDPRFGRSEIGLHRDANVPGSAGCLVVSTSDFNNKVRPLIDGVDANQIKLSVIYS